MPFKTDWRMELFMAFNSWERSNLKEVNLPTKQQMVNQGNYMSHRSPLPQL